MRSYTPQMPSELIDAFPETDKIAHSEPYPVNHYERLVGLVAKIAHHNPRVILLFRGQSQDFKKRGDASTFYPTIYRGDHLLSADILQRFRRLEQAESDLIDVFAHEKMDGAYDIRRRQLVRWSILQHYEVCPTPLLDFTHSLSVACSFAANESPGEHAFVYVFAFPYLTNRISFNSEEDLITVRLLSISPPTALRPFFQEGYLAGTTDMTSEYPDKSELDFNRRLVAKFQVPTSDDFWTKGFGAVPNSLLMPKSDTFRDLVEGIHESSVRHATPDSIGAFLLNWQPIENLILRAANEHSPKLRSVGMAINVLQNEGILEDQIALDLDSLRRFRNNLVHKAGKVSSPEVDDRTEFAEYVLEVLQGRNL